MGAVLLSIALCVHLSGILLLLFENDTAFYGISGGPFYLATACVLLMHALRPNFSLQDLAFIVLPLMLMMGVYIGFGPPIDRLLWDWAYGMGILLLAFKALAAFDEDLRRTFLAVLMALSLIGVSYYLFVALAENRSTPGAARIGEPEAIANINSVAYLCAGIVMLLGRYHPKARLLSVARVASMILMVLAVALLNSRGAIVTVLAFFLLNARSQWWRLVVLCALLPVIWSVIVTSGLVSLDNYMARYATDIYTVNPRQDERIGFMLVSLETFVANPVFGTPGYIGQDHNQWTRLLGTHGIVGLLVGGMLVWHTLRQLHLDLASKLIFVIILSLSPLGFWMSMFLAIAVLQTIQSNSSASLQPSTVSRRPTWRTTPVAP